MSAEPSWRPILEGELAERAWHALRELAATLATATAPVPDLALFWTYAAPVLGDGAAAHLEIALDRLDAAMDGVHGLGLFGGLAGLGWTIAHTIDGADDVLDAIDQRLVEVLERDDWPGHYDLIAGPVGIAVYFFERGDVPLATRGLVAIRNHLARLAERTADGITWRTRREHVPAHRREQYPDGCYDAGLAHGMAGVIAVLARMPPSISTVELRDGGIRWLMAQRTSDPARSRFPAIASPTHDGAARTAWCYGDPGVLAVLWDALARGGRSTAELESLAHAAFARSPELGGVVDTPLCHGSIGLAHIANRLYHATGDELFREAARRWYAATLDLARSGAGFATWRPELKAWAAHTDLLTGAAGIGLALAAALTPIEPTWDRLLLLELPISSPG